MINLIHVLLNEFGRLIQIDSSNFVPNQQSEIHLKHNLKGEARHLNEMVLVLESTQCKGGDLLDLYEQLAVKQFATDLVYKTFNSWDAEMFRCQVGSLVKEEREIVISFISIYFNWDVIEVKGLPLNNIPTFFFRQFASNIFVWHTPFFQNGIT